jgi:hypothetical protein
MPTVFYSCQSDRPPNINRRFIKDSIERVNRNIEREISESLIKLVFRGRNGK